MAKRSFSLSPFSSFFLPRGDTLFYLIALFSILSLLLHHLSPVSAAENRHFEGFDADEVDDFADTVDPIISSMPPPPLTTTLSVSDPIESHHGPPDPAPPVTSQPSDPKPASTSFDYWDEDEFEGIPQSLPSDSPLITESATATPTSSPSDPNLKSEPEPEPEIPKSIYSFTVEIVCVSFLIMFVINYFTGKKENENLALAWASKFATKDSIFEKNFSLLGVGETDDSPLLLKEGQNVFKFYASGRRFCQGLLATMELKSRHDLISRLYNMVVPCKDEITFEVYMNDDAMDHVVLAVARKKLAKTMQKEITDLQRFASLVSPPTGRKWVAEELAVVSESKEVAGDMINDTVLDQVFGDKAYEKFGNGFISMHFSDQHLGSHKKMLVFKFALPDAKNMADMTRLVALVPYYIDLVGRYKLSSHARTKTDGARTKVAQEIYKELQNARQEALQRKKAEQRKKIEEAEAKLSAEALRKKEAKERARQMKKAMPKMKMTRAG
ncbi:PREDICTED: uncharacterized protein At5g49945-like [Nicotiana attenuata]|uniref:DUF1682 domain-containing protein n=2 Tax=Nicotiana TaxID=4085 RepID=A0A1J6KTS6_NICAT|nr:PREDICTED: uncharacterized protein At5g49945-like [Nicotiana attenuata]OIT26179.1 uncharacterized protein A4A49_26817 [Nicotiana attenuata]